jgi:hypothetical protein
MIEIGPLRRLPDGRLVPADEAPPTEPARKRAAAPTLASLLRPGEAEAMLRLMIEDALAGDAAAARFCLSRLLGRPRGTPIRLDLAPGAEADPAAVHAATMRALADGRITPQEAAQIGRFLAALPAAEARPLRPFRRIPARPHHARGREGV